MDDTLQKSYIVTQKMNHLTLQQPTMLIPKCKSRLLFKEAIFLDLRCFAFTLKNVAKYLKTTSFGYMSHMWNNSKKLLRDIIKNFENIKLEQILGLMNKYIKNKVGEIMRIIEHV